jgi:Uma2 family endonuclease
MNMLIKSNLPKRPFFFDGKNVHYPETDGEPMAETDTHRNLILSIIKCLELFFANREDVYVTGNIMFYYVEGEPEESVAPDVMVFFGVPKGERTSYKTWEENEVMPSVVIEIASRGTWRKDRIEKVDLYAMLNVREYYIFNPQYPKTLPAFLAFRLENGVLKSVSIDNGRIYSEILGLELVDTGETLRLFNPKTDEFLKTTEEFASENEMLKAKIERLEQLLAERN